jgi:hypothetical protein
MKTFPSGAAVIYPFPDNVTLLSSCATAGDTMSEAATNDTKYKNLLFIAEIY